MDDNVSKPYSPLDQTRASFNKTELSDLTFLVGPYKEPVYAHQFVLAIGSPAFRQMLFGGLKETNSVIEIPDLTTTGVKNALRYLYGHKMDFDPSELLETYMVGNKYLFHHWSDAISEYLREKLNAQNCLSVYDQLHWTDDVQLLPMVGDFISENCEVAFKSSSFTELSENALIQILRSLRLSIQEIDVLQSVTGWISAEIQRQGLAATVENKRKLFEPIKPFIRFTDLDASEVADSDEIHGLLTSEELASLLVHSLKKHRPLTINCQAARPRGTQDLDVLNVCDKWIHFYSFETVTSFTVSHPLRVRTVYTVVKTENCPTLALNFFGPDQLQCANSETERFAENNKWCFRLKTPLRVTENRKHFMRFEDGTVAKTWKQNFASTRSEIRFGTLVENYVIQLAPDREQDQFHLIERISVLV